jgi:hypothetical protein
VEQPSNEDVAIPIVLIQRLQRSKPEILEDRADTCEDRREGLCPMGAVQNTILQRAGKVFHSLDQDFTRAPLLRAVMQ